MPTINRRLDSSSNKPAGSHTVSDHLLRAMHKVFSHDLPNQMVVLQSLLHLLDQEESARLSDKGREYVRRLLNATKRGGERFAANDFNKAILYYNDALTACPTDDRAEVNVARTYEALGNNAAAIKHYRKAAESNGPTVSDASDQAKAALNRLQASQLP